MEIPELLLIDKPKGITSFDVIRILRRQLGIKKMGHSGTLDPNATGLMIIGVGEGTKKLQTLIGLPKTYVAEIQFGVQTDSGDITGKIINKKPIPNGIESLLKEKLESMQGLMFLNVPLYSAVRRDGKRMYEYAFKGKTIETPVKLMKLLDTKLIDFEKDSAKIQMTVGSGTYVRTLAEELGMRLGTVATLRNLRRISIGHYDIKNAEKIEL